SFAPDSLRREAALHKIDKNWRMEPIVFGVEHTLRCKKEKQPRSVSNLLKVNKLVGNVVLFFSSPLFLLCHKFRYLFRAAQHGQRDSIVARAATNLRRIVAIEFGTWRSGRNGRSSGLVTFA